MAAGDKEFRDAMSRWCTGVSVVTTAHDGELQGMTVSAFSSVSVEPPTILVSLQITARTATLIDASKVFAVNVLSAGQAEVSNRFAGMHKVDNRFEGIDYTLSANGTPILRDTLATLECEVSESVTVTTHTIYIATVQAVITADTDPLLYFRGGYQEMVYGRRKKPR